MKEEEGVLKHGGGDGQAGIEKTLDISLHMQNLDLNI